MVGRAMPGFDGTRGGEAIGWRGGMEAARKADARKAHASMPAPHLQHHHIVLGDALWGSKRGCMEATFGFLVQPEYPACSAPSPGRRGASPTERPRTLGTLRQHHRTPAFDTPHAFVLDRASLASRSSIPPPPQPQGGHVIIEQTPSASEHPPNPQTQAHHHHHQARPK